MNYINLKKRNAYRRSKPKEDNEISFLKDVLLRRLKKKSKKKVMDTIIAGRNISVDSLCAEFGVGRPAGTADAKVYDIAARPDRMKKGGVILMMETDTDLYPKMFAKAAEKKAAAVFADRALYERSGISDPGVPLILIDDAVEAFKDYYKAYRDDYSGRLIGITGSVGKTTTKSFIKAVVDKKYKAFVSPVSRNALYQITGNIFYKMRSDNEVYVQEIGAMQIDSIRTSAEILRPDITVLTNVKPHHLKAYGSFENVFRDKMSLVDNLSPGGSAVINFDDENLAAHPYSCNVVSFGIDTEKEVDYRGMDIEQNGGVLEMDIEYGGGSKVHVKAAISGRYNAYNILAAFAVGKLLDISDEVIAEGIAGYSSSGIRQNITEYGSNTFMIDCFNVTNDTIVNSVKVMEEYEIRPGGRKIAIIGGENTLGEYRVEKTKELGMRLCGSSVDEIVCFGSSRDDEASRDKYGDARVLYDTLRENGFTNTRLITSFSDIVEYMENEVGTNDMVLFKCIIYLNMPTAIDAAFGTSVSLTHPPVVRKSKKVKSGGLKGLKVAYMDRIYISNAVRTVLDSPKLTIPSQIDGCDIFGMSKGVFAYTGIEDIDFGDTIKMIGIGAFRDCRKLRKLEFPDSLMHVMEGAFRNCRNLTEVRFGSRIKQIDSNAFAGCTALKTVIIPQKEDLKIEKGAFPPGADIIYR